MLTKKEHSLKKITSLGCKAREGKGTEHRSPSLLPSVPNNDSSQGQGSLGKSYPAPFGYYSYPSCSRRRFNTSLKKPAWFLLIRSYKNEGCLGLVFFVLFFLKKNPRIIVIQICWASFYRNLWENHTHHKNVITNTDEDIHLTYVNLLT